MSKLLSQGGYGCIFKPGMYCSGKTTENEYVSKLMVFNDSAKNELLMSLRIRKIPNFDKFFIPAKSFCYVKKKVLKNNKDIKDCDIFTKNKQKKQFILMRLNYLHSSNISDFFLSYQNKISNNIIIYITIYKKLLVQIKKLQSVNIVHYDLRPNNILISNQNFNPYIIDFGISLNMIKIFKLLRNKDSIKKKLTDVGKFYIFAPDNCYWSFDVHIINFIIHNYDGLDNKFSYKYKLNTFKKFVYENSSFKYLSEEYKQNYWNNCVEYLEHLTRFTNYEVLLKLMKNYKKWDITGLSMTFIRIVSFNNALKNEPITQQFIKLLLSNVRYDSTNILSCDEQIDYLNQLKVKKD